MEKKALLNNDLLEFPKTVIIIIVSFLEFKEFIYLSNTSKKIKKYFAKNKILRHYVILGSITENYRKAYYRYIIDINKIKSDIINELYYLNVSNINELYKQINIIVENEKKNDKNIRFKQLCSDISLDNDHTNQNEYYQSKESNNKLKSFLSSMVFLRPEIEYNQNINSICIALISILQDHEFSFWIFLSLLDKFNLSLLFLNKMSEYKIRLYQLNKYIQKYLPNLYKHFNSYHINTDILFSKWILTLFSSYLPYNTLSKIWDVFILDGWKSIFRFSLSFLSEIYDVIINMDLNAMTKYLKGHMFNIQANYNKIKKLYFKFKITNKELIEFAEDFYIDKVKKKIDVYIF